MIYFPSLHSCCCCCWLAGFHCHLLYNIVTFGVLLSLQMRVIHFVFIVSVACEFSKTDVPDCNHEVDAVNCRHCWVHRQTSTQNLVRNVLPLAVLWICSSFQTHILTLQLSLRYRGLLEAKYTSTATSRLTILNCWLVSKICYWTYDTLLNVW